jgi:type I restriction enzyme S subunit
MVLLNITFLIKDGKPYKDNNGKMIDSELGLIPEGWRVTTYGEMEDLKNRY